VKSMMAPQSHREHRERHDPLTQRVIGAAIEVHRHLGPGLLESTYERCLAHELSLSGIQVERQVELPVRYKGLTLDNGYRMDLLINSSLILELKSVEKLTGIHEAQLLTYMKLSGLNKGLLINFNEPLLKNGIKRFVL